MAYPITRQFGPNAKGSELSFTDMDYNLLYLDAKVTGSNGYIAFFSGSSVVTASIINQSSNKIGIGTTNPYTLFNVVGITTIGYPGVSSDSYIQFWPNISGESAYYITDSGSVLRIGTGEKASSGTDVLNIASTNVGIGTDSPQAKFVISNNGAQGMEFGYSAVLTSSYVESFNRATNLPTDMTYYLGPGTGSHRFYTGGAERMRINKDGYVGINKNNPTAPLDIVGTTIVTGSAFINGGSLNIINSYPRLFLTDTDSDSDFSLINDNGNFTIYDDTNTAPRIYITASGSIGINKFSPNSALDVNGNATISGSLEVSGTFTTRGYPTIISGLNNADTIINIGNSGSNSDRTAYIYTQYNSGTMTINNQKNGLVLAANNTNVMYITSSYVGIGVSAPTHILHINGQGRSTNSAWATTSDIRLKENITDYTLGLNELIKIHTICYNYIPSVEGMSESERLRPRVGISAQEIEKILPNTVTKVKENGLEDQRLFNNDELIFLLVNSVKEQQSQIEELKSQVEVLLSNFK